MIKGLFASAASLTVLFAVLGFFVDPGFFVIMVATCVLVIIASVILFWLWFFTRNE